jgi:hypothetical protein
VREFRVWDSEFRFRFRIWSLESKVQGLRFQVLGSGFNLQDKYFRV